jgi:hypothetical protein
MASDTITLAIDGEVTLRRFAGGVSRFQKLITALSAEVAEGRIEWIIDDLAPGSALATIRGCASDMTRVEPVVRAYGNVGKALERKQLIPYSPRVEEPARQIVKVLASQRSPIRSIRFETPEEEAIILSEPVRAQAPAAASRARATYGAFRVEFKPSRVEAASGSRCMTIWKTSPFIAI